MVVILVPVVTMVTVQISLVTSHVPVILDIQVSSNLILGDQFLDLSSFVLPAKITIFLFVKLLYPF